jgi:hypothetical protein
VAFVCECAEEHCRRAVPLSPSAYLTLRGDGEAVLYPGHTPIADAPLAAELAQTQPAPDVATGSTTAVVE